MCCCKGFWKRIVPFAAAFVIGILAAGFLHKIVLRNENRIAPKYGCQGYGYEFGSGEGNGIGSGKVDVGGSGSGGGIAIDETPRAGTNPLQITFKPRPSYTTAARENETTGAVRLRVTFLANGQIGSVTPVSGLPDRLTEEAISAAKNIKFEPATIDGKPVTITRIIEYRFSIY